MLPWCKRRRVRCRAAVQLECDEGGHPGRTFHWTGRRANRCARFEIVEARRRSIQSLALTKMTDAEFKRMAKAVNRWLSFQILCGREMLLSESYLCQPLAEYLLQHHNGALDTEFGHPQLTQGGRGRPRQVDFVLLTPEAGDVCAAIESKWVADRPYSKQAIVDDLLRLECFRQEGRHVQRYFLAAGRKTSFMANFATVEMNAGGQRQPFADHLLSFDTANKDRAVEVMNCDTYRRRYYKDFAMAYSTHLPRGFHTSLMSLEDNDDISVCLWKVESRRNRRTFDSGQEGW